MLAFIASIFSGISNLAKLGMIFAGLMKDNRNVRIGEGRAAQRGQKELLDDIQRDKERDILISTDAGLRSRLLRRFRDKKQG